MSLDLDDELGDATEVYAVSPVIETDYVLQGDLFDGRIEDVPATWRIDEIYDGQVCLAVSWGDSDRRASAAARVKPDTARDFGLALLRAADYADRQREGDE